MRPGREQTPRALIARSHSRGAPGCIQKQDFEIGARRACERLTPAQRRMLFAAFGAFQHGHSDKVEMNTELGDVYKQASDAVARLNAEQKQRVFKQFHYVVMPQGKPQRRQDLRPPTAMSFAESLRNTTQFALTAEEEEVERLREELASKQATLAERTQEQQTSQYSRSRAATPGCDRRLKHKNDMEAKSMHHRPASSMNHRLDKSWMETVQQAPRGQYVDLPVGEP